MVSCSGFGLPLHAQLLRLFVTDQRRPTTQHAAQGSNPPTGALYMQLAKIPHTHQTTPPATRAASTDQHGTHCGRNRYYPSAHTTKDEAPGQLPGAQKQKVDSCRGLALWLPRVASFMVLCLVPTGYAWPVTSALLFRVVISVSRAICAASLASLKDIRIFCTRSHLQNVPRA